MQRFVKEFNVEVDFLRPNELARDNSSLSDVIEFVIKKYETSKIFRLKIFVCCGLLLLFAPKMI
jgi:hypothetical protein